MLISRRERRWRRERKTLKLTQAYWTTTANCNSLLHLQ